MKIIDYFNEEETIWVLVENEGRVTYWGLKAENEPAFNGDLSVIYDNQPRTKEILLDAIQKAGFDPAKLPHIEDVKDKPFKDLWLDIMASENCMWFIDEPTYIGEEECAPWHDYGISREEYENIIDSNIEKYNLGDVIEKYEDETLLYTCYGNFMSCFSEAVIRED